MRWTARRERFRSVLEGSDCVHPGSVFDPVSARIAEDLGFEVGILAGSVASFTVLGAPDLIVLTLSEFADQAYRICRAGNLPLLVDADHGYGNALSVMRTVEELERAGVAALSIEDTELPQPFGTSAQRLLSLEEGVGKMRAALAARRDPNLVIAGRTSAPAITDLADAISRCRAYAAAGVDAIFVVGLKSRRDLEALCEAVRLPLIIAPLGESVPKDELGRMGVRIALQGHQPFAAGVAAVHATLKALRDGGAPGELQGIASPALMKQVLREDDYARWTREFLGGAG